MFSSFLKIHIMYAILFNKVLGKACHKQTDNHCNYKHNDNDGGYTPHFLFITKVYHDFTSERIIFMGIGSYAFIIIMTTCFLIMRANTVSDRKRTQEEQDFWSRESEANSVRRKDISTLDYVQIEVQSLPVNELDTLIRSKYLKELARLANEKIINLSSDTNTDLKLMYGPANLNDLTKYDLNYTALIRLLDNIGKDLISSANEDTAVIFLEYAVSIGSDITSTYTALGNIYHSKNETEKMNKLISSAEKITSLSGAGIVSKLKELRSSS